MITVGIKVRCKGKRFDEKHELIKQAVAIPGFGLDVRIEIIDQIYVEKYTKYLCFCWFEHYAKGNSRV
jgi:hypothetical protein